MSCETHGHSRPDGGWHWPLLAGQLALASGCTTTDYVNANPSNLFRSGR
jgi:hypothetical protein